MAGMPEASARSGSAWRLGLCSGGGSASMKMLPPRRPTLPVSTASTWIRYEVRVENRLCSTARSNMIAADSASA